jgi:hypothetical protein
MMTRRRSMALCPRADPNPLFVPVDGGQRHRAVTRPTCLEHVPEPIDLFSIEDDLRLAPVQVLDPVGRMFVDADDARDVHGTIGFGASFFNCAAAFASNPDLYTDSSEPM